MWQTRRMFCGTRPALLATQEAMPELRFNSTVVGLWRSWVSKGTDQQENRLSGKRWCRALQHQRGLHNQRVGLRSPSATLARQGHRPHPPLAALVVARNLAKQQQAHTYCLRGAGHFGHVLICLRPYGCETQIVGALACTNHSSYARREHIVFNSRAFFSVCSKTFRRFAGSLAEWLMRLPTKQFSQEARVQISQGPTIFFCLSTIKRASCMRGTPSSAAELPCPSSAAELP